MLFGHKDSFQDGNQWTYQIWPVQLVYGRTGHFEELSIANIGPSIEKIQIPVNILPRMYSYAVRTKRQLSKWESMDIPDLTCTARVRSYKDFEELSIANIGPSIDNIQIPVDTLPRTVQLCCYDQKTAFKMGINGHTRFDLYSSWTVVQGTLKNSP